MTGEKRIAVKRRQGSIFQRLERERERETTLGLWLDGGQVEGDAYSISSISSSIALHSHSSISLKSQLHSFLQPEEAPPTSSSPSEEQISAKTQKPTSSSPAASSISVQEEIANKWRKLNLKEKATYGSALEGSSTQVNDSVNEKGFITRCSADRFQKTRI
ncbi:UB-like protease 1A [Prunus dulcis]|uniref:UB-like protease 1A n=1 Tax=Prunus dulcis TaxID=3755 RepID=A0A4Y1RII6_PRUDU|nr:UB-like protease 1A [Prunus dulcis]